MMRRRQRKGRQMTELEAAQRTAMFLIGLLGGEAAPRKRRRNRGAARRAKLALQRRAELTAI
jgi:hypothetical protein